MENCNDIHEASLYGDYECVLELLGRGACPNVRDFAGRTPLHMAAMGGHVSVMVLLLDHGAYPDARDDKAAYMGLIQPPVV
jgi:ankyrin repeat protein